MAEIDPLDGWTVTTLTDGSRRATKRFADHYKEVRVADGGDLEGACASIQLEADLRAQKAAQVNEDLAAEYVALAAELRS